MREPRQDHHSGSRSSTIAVLGGTGFVGQHLARTWRDHNAPTSILRLLVHRARPQWISASECEVREVDLSSPASIEEALDGCAVLINLLRPNGDGWLEVTVARLMPVIDRRVSALVHASSIDVYGAAGGAIVTETTTPQPLSPYAQEHMKVEKIIAGASVPSTILRVGAVFGTGGRNLISMAEQVAHEPGWKLALRRAVNGRRRFHLVAVETVVDALRFVAQRSPDRAGEVVLVTEDGDDDNNFAFVQQSFAKAFARTIPALPRLPPFVLRSMLLLSGRATADPFRRFCGDKLQRLGFEPSQPFRESIDRYASALAAHHVRRSQ